MMAFDFPLQPQRQGRVMYSSLSCHVHLLYIVLRQSFEHLRSNVFLHQFVHHQVYKQQNRTKYIYRATINHFNIYLRQSFIIILHEIIKFQSIALLKLINTLFMKKENLICIALLKRITSKSSHQAKRKSSFLPSNSTHPNNHRQKNFPHALNTTQRPSFLDQSLQITSGRKRRWSQVVGRINEKNQEDEDLCGWSIHQQQDPYHENRNQIKNKPRELSRHIPKEKEKPKPFFHHINTSPHLNTKTMNNISNKVKFQDKNNDQSRNKPPKIIFYSKNNQIYNKENKEFVPLHVKPSHRRIVRHDFDHLRRFQNWIKAHMPQQEDFQL